MKFPPIETVLVFKDGNTVIRSFVKLPKNLNKVRTEMPSSCVHGTCWVTCDHSKILSLKSVKSDLVHEHTSQVSSIRDVLLGNVGRKVLLLCGISCPDRKTIAGVVLNVLENLVVLSCESKEIESGVELIIPISKIEIVQGEKLSQEFKQKEKIRMIEIEYESGGEDDFAMVYSILKNCSWAPSYLLSLNTQKHLANLKMQSTVINDSQNFFAKEFICAAGNPKFSYQHVDDPFVTEGLTHEDFLASLGCRTYNTLQLQQRQQPQIRRGGRTRQTARMSTGGRAPRRQLATFSSQEDEEEEKLGKGATATDYYYYKFEGISVEKGQRVLLPVFSQEMKFEDMYKCKLNYIQGSKDPLLVTHCVKLINNSSVIWTTGPVCIRSDQQLFAGQSTVHFTTPGMDAMIDIADALSIRVNYEENTQINEKKIKENKDYAVRYVESIQNCITDITNFQDKDILILIESNFIGQYVEKSASSEPTKHNKVYHQQYDNANSLKVHMEWRLEVKTGETKQLKFAYSKWINARNTL